MDEVKVIHDEEGHTLTIWIDDPKKEVVCEETTDEVVMMKDGKGRVIGFEVLNYHPSRSSSRSRPIARNGRAKKLRAKSA